MQLSENNGRVGKDTHPQDGPSGQISDLATARSVSQPVPNNNQPSVFSARCVLLHPLSPAIHEESKKTLTKRRVFGTDRFKHEQATRTHDVCILFIVK